MEIEMKFKLGKKPARKGAIKFQLKRYIDFDNYPPPPAFFGNYKVVTYNMFKNDEIGDCVFAGAANEHIDWSVDNGDPITFSDEAVIAAYSAVTGFDPSDPATDQGTDMQEAASFRRHTGITDTNGRVHKIYAYATIPANDLKSLKAAMYYFGGAGIGIRFPAFAMEQFEAGKPWDVQSENDQLEGGHYVAGIGWTETDNIVVATWGKYQEMTPAFALKYIDELCFYLDPTRIMKRVTLQSDRTPEGIDLIKLQQDIVDLPPPELKMGIVAPEAKAKSML